MPGCTSPPSSTSRSSGSTSSIWEVLPIRFHEIPSEMTDLPMLRLVQEALKHQPEAGFSLADGAWLPVVGKLVGNISANQRGS